jgi:hypothetical protein
MVKHTQYEVTASSSITITNEKQRTPIIYLLPTLKMLLPPKFSFRLKNNQVAFTHKYSLRKRERKISRTKSFDASDMLYLIMPDRFANVIATHKDTK